MIDVPGHERFVRTMVAGATGIDLFLLVVAADDGVMPQTREHLAVLEALEVPAGVVAVTKADVVEPDELDLARGDVADLLRDGPYADAEVIAVSGLTRGGARRPARCAGSRERRRRLIAPGSTDPRACTSTAASR